MSEYIEREAYVNYLASREKEFVDDYGKGFVAGIRAAKRAVMVFPAADVAPVVHGRWIDGMPYVNSRWRVCSVCHRSAHDPAGGDAYCSYCGARMDGDV